MLKFDEAFHPVFFRKCNITVDFFLQFIRVKGMEGKSYIIEISIINYIHFTQGINENSLKCKFLLRVYLYQKPDIYRVASQSMP